MHPEEQTDRLARQVTCRGVERQTDELNAEVYRQIERIHAERRVDRQTDRCRAPD